MLSRLSDLEELVLRIKSPSARTYLTEAVSAYQSGALRSAIVATWIAVVFDILDKLKELELTGDKNAKKHVEAFEKAQREHDIGLALEFERCILDIAKDEFQLLSPQEHLDLVRLHDDRNRCAHPSMITDGVYTPSAELVRYHIRNAVTHLLEHPPVQGQAALARLLKEMDSEFFPTSTKDAMERFSKGPLSRPRDSLVRNFVIVLLKGLLRDEIEPDRQRRLDAALNAVHAMHTRVVEATFVEKLSPLLRELKDEQLPVAVGFILEHPFAWRLADSDVRDGIERFVLNLPDEHLGTVLDLAYRSVVLQPFAAKRMEKVSIEGIVDLLCKFERPLSEYLLNRAVSDFSRTSSFEESNSLAVALNPHVAILTEEQVKALVLSVSLNRQAFEAHKVRSLLKKVRDSSLVLAPVFDRSLQVTGLGEKMPNLVGNPDDVPF